VASPAKRSAKAAFDYRELVAYLVVAVLALGIGAFGLQVWKADLHVPFTYQADAMLNGMLVKTSVEHGWIQSNPTIGLPGQMDLADFPFGETLDFAVIKVISLFARDWALSMNLFFLLTFPLTAVLAMWPLRRLGIGVWPAGVTALIYSILPYHLTRGESHLGLAAYFLVPPMVLVCLWCMRDEPLLFTGHGAKKWQLKLRDPEAIIAIVICALTAFGGIYYAFFACFFLFVAGAIAALRRGNWQLLVSAVVLIAVIVGFGVINLSPSLIYHRLHGDNPAASVRNPGQAEIYALKIDQLFLPVDGHRIPKFAAIKALYHQGVAQINRYLDNEAVVTNPLGIVGVLAFLLVVFMPFVGEPVRRWFGAKRFEMAQQLGQLQLLGLLLGTVGGFGAMVAFVLPQIRSYNRIVVFLAFFGAVVLAFALDRMMARAKSAAGRAAWMIALVLLLAFAVFDQTSPALVPPYADNNAAYASDATYVASLEHTLPSNAAVFQLPYMPFPEPGGPLVNMPDYEPLRGYLHSTTLRWSYGAQKGRAADAWQRQVASAPVAQMVAELKSAGFSAVWVDRNGYEDGGEAVEAQLASVTSSTPIVSPDKTFATFVIAR
jgi:hypothetical protein